MKKIKFFNTKKHKRSRTYGEETMLSGVSELIKAVNSQIKAEVVDRDVAICLSKVIVHFVQVPDSSATGSTVKHSTLGILGNFSAKTQNLKKNIYLAISLCIEQLTRQHPTLKIPNEAESPKDSFF